MLGQILFLILISDINEYLPKGVAIEKYADGIIAYIIGKPVLIQNLPQHIVDGIQAWCIVNKMRLNTTKCKTLVVQGKQSKPTQLVTLKGQPLEEVTWYKYLGIEINNKLDWNQQWERVHQQIKSVQYLLKRLKFLGFREELLITAYRSYAISHIS